jgi:hypothetical protein
MSMIITNTGHTRFELLPPSEFTLIYQTLLASLTASQIKDALTSFLETPAYNFHIYSTKQSISQRNTETVLSDQFKDGWITHIREHFYSTSQVEAIYMTINENDIDIWLLIPNRDIAIVRQLAEKETEILARFAALERPPFLVEFHVVYRCGADESQFVPQQAIRLPR